MRNDLIHASVFKGADATQSQVKPLIGDLLSLFNASSKTVKYSFQALTFILPYQVDGLSGATITGNGVSNSIKYWFGEHGYGALLQKLKSGGM